jgi:hypothetical protein
LASRVLPVPGGPIIKRLWSISPIAFILDFLGLGFQNLSWESTNGTGLFLHSVQYPDPRIGRLA